MGALITSTDVNGDYLASTFDPVTGFPCSMFFWIKKDASGLDNHFFYTDTATGNRNMGISVSGSTGAANAGKRNTSSINATTSNTITNDGNWHSVIGVWTSDTLVECWLDNDDANKGSNTSSGTFPTAADAFAINALIDSSPVYNDSGELAEIAAWDNYALTASDRATLHARYSPEFIRPDKRTLYRRLLRETEEGIGGSSWDIKNLITAVTTHPAIIYPSNDELQFLAAAAPGGLSVPVAMNSYRQRRGF